MLTHLQLRDLVLVDQAELELQGGLTALTGETGAGKSIVVDALLLIAGGRGAGDIARQGAERAEVTASFTLLPPNAVNWLKDQSIDHDGEIVHTFGKINSLGYNTTSVEHGGLNSPYDAKRIGDYTGITPPFDNDHDADDQ